MKRAEENTNLRKTLGNAYVGFGFAQQNGFRPFCCAAGSHAQ